MIFGRTLLILIYFLYVIGFGILLKCSDVLHNLFCMYHNLDNEDVFDYIIVGGGSAGSIIADKLAQNGFERVLVLEAGKQSMELLGAPAMGILLQNTHFDWGYKTVPQENACLALERNVSIWPMGKILGGTSMFNNMLYVRGHEQDFNDWFKESEDYSYSDILKYFKNIEKFEDTDLQETNIYVSNLTFSTFLPNIVKNAAKSLGYPVISETYKNKLGFGTPKANLHKGKRWTSAEKIKKHRSPNLLIRTSCMVEQVLFKSKFEAYGVKYNYMGKNYKSLARKAIILSAGVIGSPKILMLSGIGPKEDLKQLDIPLVVDLPVGYNLQDHVTTGVDLVMLKTPLNIGLERMLSPFSIWEYFVNGAGPWTTTGCDVMGFLNIENGTLQDSGVPNLQFMVMQAGLKEDDGHYLRKLLGISDKVWSSYFSKFNKKTMSILPVVLHPKSKGNVRLASKDPHDQPLINPRYLSNIEDINLLISGIRLVKTLIETKEFKSFGAEFNSNILPDCVHHTFDTDNYWECYIRHLTITAYHPVGTCKMGKFEDESTVVDYNFKVKGTNKLYVVDGSVIPSLPSGNVNGPIMMLAAMAADMVKKVYYQSFQKCRIIDIFIPKNVC